MADENVKVIIEAFAKASAILTDIGKSVQNLGSAGQETSPKIEQVSASAEGAGVSALQMAEAFGIAVTAIGVLNEAAKLVKETFREATHAFLDHEESTIRLGVAMANLGDNSLEAQGRVDEFTGRMADLAVVMPGVIRQGEILLTTIGKLSGEGLERATHAAIELSAATGRDLESSFMVLSRAAAGSTAMLARYGIVVDQGLTSQEKYQQALSIIERQMGGTAEAISGTLGKSLESLHLQLIQGIADLVEFAAAQSGWKSPIQEAVEHQATLNKSLKLTEDQLAEVQAKAGYLPDYFLQFNNAAAALGLKTLPEVADKVELLHEAFDTLTKSGLPVAQFKALQAD